MKDINGQELREGGYAMLLCEVVKIDAGAVVLRVMNSDTQLAVGSKHDEVLGGMVADSELTVFEPEQYPVPGTQLVDHSDEWIKPPPAPPPPRTNAIAGDPARRGLL